MTSMDAAWVVSGPLDYFHLDGCHSEWSSTTDVVLWVPKVKSGGIVVLDDYNWPSTQTAVRFVEKWCDKIEVTETKDSAYAFFRKR